MEMPRGRNGHETVTIVKPQSTVVHPCDGMALPEEPGSMECRLLLCAAMAEKVPVGTIPSAGSLLGYGVMMDLHDPVALKGTRKAGLPWTRPCMFDGSSIISDFVPSTETGDTTSLEVYLDVDGDQRASLTTRDLLMDVRSALKVVTGTMSLYPGDIVGIEVRGTAVPVRSGSRFEAGISSIAVVRGSFKGAP
jgi:2-keto-4-pentenoate hydratase/2-oxohepta-3-ene-1,7-dioic acid hydratase in catechol pathway